MKSIIFIFCLSILFSSCTRKPEPDRMDGLYDLYLYDLKKSTNSKITNSPDIIEYPVSFSNDASKIIFKSINGIQIMNLDGSDINIINESKALSSIRLSPDGKEFAYTENGILYLMNIDGTNIQRLTNVDYKVWVPVWSPDGQKIACSSDSGIVVVDLEGKAESITKVKPNDWYDWSYDSRKLTISRRNGLYSQIYILDSELRTESKITASERYNYFPSWRPGSNEILFTSSIPDYGSDLIISNVDGTVQKTLLHQSWISSPAWSPDGSKIAFIDGNSDLAIIDFDGTNLKVVNTVPGACLQPIWSPDGNFILYNRAVFYD
jgi:Tol biopolymer transport system component